MENSISKSLIELRKSKKYTQSQFGKMLGMSRSKVSSWEIGRRDISISDAVIVCDYFEIGLDCLLNPQGISSNKIINIIEKYIELSDVSSTERKRMADKINKVLLENMKEN